MRQKQSIKPQDIAILAKLISLTHMKHHKDSKMSKVVLSQDQLAKQLHISQGEIAKGLSRLRKSKLIFNTDVNVPAAKEFLIHGFKFVFPMEVGRIGVGVATGSSNEYFKSSFFDNEEALVWPHAKGKQRGQIITPLYPGLAEGVLVDNNFYVLMSALEMLRSENKRVIKIGREFIEKEVI